MKAVQEMTDMEKIMADYAAFHKMRVAVIMHSKNVCIKKTFKK